MQVRSSARVCVDYHDAILGARMRIYAATGREYPDGFQPVDDHWHGPDNGERGQAAGTSCLAREIRASGRKDGLHSAVIGLTGGRLASVACPISSTVSTGTVTAWT